MPKKLAPDVTPSFSIDSLGRVYRKYFGQWHRMKGVRADTIVNVSQERLKRSLNVIRFQRYVIWSLVVLSLVLLCLRGCR